MSESTLLRPMWNGRVQCNVIFGFIYLFISGGIDSGTARYLNICNSFKMKTNPAKNL